jgi:azurin
MRFAEWIFGLSVALLCVMEASAETRLDITAIPGLRYDYKQFTVSPGEKVVLTLINNDTMLHNLLIVKPGSRMTVVNAALALGNRGQDLNYVPANDNVLWAIGVVPQNDRHTLTFSAPNTEGDYPYVCTYPGHGLVMFGTMTVSTTPQPPVKNLPMEMAEHAHHKPIREAGRTYVQRTFMPDAGPASIAVMMPDDQSYCWDAGACRFRYAWSGGGLKQERPSTKPLKTSALDGDVYYVESGDFPLMIGEPRKAPTLIEFKGYTKNNTGQPEFEYHMDGVQVREFIEHKDGELLRRFRTNNHKETIWFRIEPSAADRVTSSVPQTDGFFKFIPKESDEFVVRINIGEVE